MAQGALSTTGVRHYGLELGCSVRYTGAGAYRAASHTACRTCNDLWWLGGTGISGLMRGLVTLPQGGSRSLQWSATGMEDPQEEPLAVHCFCVCIGSALLGDLLGVSRTRERDLLSVLLIYPRILLCIFIVYRHVVRILCCCILLYVDLCRLLWFSCQYLPSDWLERSFWGHLNVLRKAQVLHKAQVEESVCVYFSFLWFVYVAMCSPALHNIYFIRLWHDIAYLCWKCC